MESAPRLRTLVAYFLLLVVQRLSVSTILGAPAILFAALVGGIVASLSAGAFLNGALILGGAALGVYSTARLTLPGIARYLRKNSGPYPAVGATIFGTIVSGTAGGIVATLSSGAFQNGAFILGGVTLAVYIVVALTSAVLEFLANYWMLYPATTKESQMDVRVYVYRVTDIQDHKEFVDQQSKHWVEFLESVPHIGYESFDLASANLLQNRLGGPVINRHKGSAIFVFVKEYWKGDNRISLTRHLIEGHIFTAEELRKTLDAFVNPVLTRFQIVPVAQTV